MKTNTTKGLNNDPTNRGSESVPDHTPRSSIDHCEVGDDVEVQFSRRAGGKRTVCGTVVDVQAADAQSSRRYRHIVIDGDVRLRIAFGGGVEDSSNALIGYGADVWRVATDGGDA